MINKAEGLECVTNMKKNGLKFKTFGLETPLDTPTTCAAAYAAIVVQVLRTYPAMPHPNSSLIRTM
jgi:hypothetical protein